MLGRLLDDPVLDIGQVHHLGDAVSLLEQDPPQQVLEEKGPEVTDVSVIVNGRAAGIHPDVPHFDRLELFHLPTHRVVEAHRGHVSSRSSTTA